MKEGPSKTNLNYGQALVHSGLSGLRRGRDSQLEGQRLSAVLTRSALASLSLAALGAWAALFRLRRHDRRSISRTVAYGIAGGAIGFAAGFTWKTRDLTASMARSALKEMGTVRDERWIAKHPINYG
ncbi:MAG TPA: hypothetical protein VII95_06950 [Terriglobales bacterium]|jgi:hypothetical protein